MVVNLGDRKRRVYRNIKQFKGKGTLNNRQLLGIDNNVYGLHVIN